eukprot:1915842-Karenia_brevis.AAC.1
MVWPKESGIGILDHMVTKGVNRRHGVAQESGIGILGYMVIKGVQWEWCGQGAWSGHLGPHGY